MGWLPNALIIRPDAAHRLWLGKHCVAVSWLGLTMALVSPPSGPGISLCWLQSATGLPCPGCGLLRSLSCGMRGLFSQSWHYHPLGLLILALFVFTAAQSLLPKPIRHDLAQFLRAKPRLSISLYLAFVLAFVGFGLARGLLCFALNHRPMR